jgi:hypothetical protein
MKLADVKVGEKYIVILNRNPEGRDAWAYDTYEAPVEVLRLGVKLGPHPHTSKDWGWRSVRERGGSVGTQNRTIENGKYVLVREVGRAQDLRGEYVIPSRNIKCTVAEDKAHVSDRAEAYIRGDLLMAEDKVPVLVDLTNVDWPLLRDQVSHLLEAKDWMMDVETVDAIEGIIHLLDYIRDEAADQGVPSTDLFNE